MYVSPMRKTAASTNLESSRFPLCTVRFSCGADFGVANCWWGEFPQKRELFIDNLLVRIH